MTLAELKENWEDYHIYYGKPRFSLPRNILFDPKNDEIRLVGDGWHRIADQQALSEKISETQAHWGSHEVMIIEGPDRQLANESFARPCRDRCISSTTTSKKAMVLNVARPMICH